MCSDRSKFFYVIREFGFINNTWTYYTNKIKGNKNVSTTNFHYKSISPPKI